MLLHTVKAGCPIGLAQQPLFTPVVKSSSFYWRLKKSSSLLSPISWQFKDYMEIIYSWWKDSILSFFFFPLIFFLRQFSFGRTWHLYWKRTNYTKNIICDQWDLWGEGRLLFIEGFSVKVITLDMRNRKHWTCSTLFENLEASLFIFWFVFLFVKKWSYAWSERW